MNQLEESLHLIGTVEGRDYPDEEEKRSESDCRVHDLQNYRDFLVEKERSYLCVIWMI